MSEPLFSPAASEGLSAPSMERCPACAAAKLIPRKGWPAVLWCFGCSANFDGTTKTPICLVKGAAALTFHGEIIAPFTPAAPAVLRSPLDATRRRPGSDE